MVGWGGVKVVLGDEGWEDGEEFFFFFWRNAEYSSREYFIVHDCDIFPTVYKMAILGNASAHLMEIY